MSSAVIDATGLRLLVSALIDRGYRVVGPTLSDNSIVLSELKSADDLPRGWGVDVGPGHYRLRRRDDDALFGHSAGPQSWKQFLHPPRQKLWSSGGQERWGHLPPEGQGDEPVHFVQMWVVPDESGITPGYQQLEIDDELLRGGLVTIASGMPEHSDDAAITIRNKYAALHGARMQPGDSIELPQAQYLHLFVPRGQVTLEGAGPLHEGDAVRLTATGGQRVTATEPAEILVWEMHAGLAAA